MQVTSRMIGYSYLSPTVLVTAVPPVATVGTASSPPIVGRAPVTTRRQPVAPIVGNGLGGTQFNFSGSGGSRGTPTAQPLGATLHSFLSSMFA